MLGPMNYLRLMTFNVQFLPNIVTAAGGESESRAGNVAAAILALAPEERPDVIAFNEVFNDDGREVLVSKLGALYPHIVDELDDCNFGQDSGLMLVSRFPLLGLPKVLGPVADDRVLFFSYPDSADTDSGACKGVGVCLLETPLGLVALAFTHPQAYYKSEDQYRDVRAKQMDDVGKTLSRVLGATNTQWDHAIVIGDLNVRGDADATSDERETLFDTGGSVFTTHLCDGWRTYMRPPATPRERDPGYTNNNLEAGEDGQLPIGMLARLDYQCFGKPAARVLVPQHMRTRFRHLSDHWSLESDVHVLRPHNTPSDAVEWRNLPPLKSGMRVAPLFIDEPGVYQWLFVASGGTYTLFPPDAAGVEMRIYAQDNLSTPLTAYDHKRVLELGLPDLVSEVRQFAGTMSSTGSQYEIPGPFFVRVRGGVFNPGFTGSCSVGVFEHRGQTRETAFVLRPWADALDPHLPATQPNGAEDECWFRANLERAFSGKPHTATFAIENGTGHKAKVQLFQPDGTSIGDVGGADAVLSLGRTTEGPEVLFLLLRRTSFADIAFRASLRDTLTFLRSVPNVRPMVLRAIDETGPDWMGADEINLKLFADGMETSFYEQDWGDADSDEILKLESSVPEIGFVDTIAVRVVEDDFISGLAETTVIAALADGDPPIKAAAQSFSVQSGTYQFECTLSRTRE